LAPVVFETWVKRVKTGCNDNAPDSAAFGVGQEAGARKSSSGGANGTIGAAFSLKR